MPALEGRPSPHRWNQIRRLGVFPAIESLKQYEEAVLRGGKDALAYLRSIEPVQELTVADVAQVHEELFRNVHPWAGQFRQPGQLAIVAGYPAAEPPRIVRELELALVQMREILDRALAAGERHQTLAALALFHVRFERVHPFQDGNGRVGRTILLVQFEKAFGVQPSFDNQAGYREAIRASNRGDLAPLMNYLGASVLLPPVESPWHPPFKLAPRFLEEAEGNPTFQDDLAWSRSAPRIP